MLLETVERGQEERAEREKYQYERETSIGLPLVHALTRDQTHNLGMCSDQELNP